MAISWWYDEISDYPEWLTPEYIRKEWLQGTWKTEEEMSRDQIVDKSVQKAPFKIGDNIKRIKTDNMSLSIGDVTTVTSIKFMTDRGKWEINNNWWAENFELVEFKIGDKVKIRKDSEYYGAGGNNPKERTGIIRSFSGQEPPIRVDLDSLNPNYHAYYNDHDLELVTEEKDFTGSKQSDTIVTQTEAIGIKLKEIKKVKGFEVGKHYKCVKKLEYVYITVGNYYECLGMVDNHILLKRDNGVKDQYKVECFDPIAREDQVTQTVVPAWFEAAQAVPNSEIKVRDSAKLSDLVSPTYTIKWPENTKLYGDIKVQDSINLTDQTFKVIKGRESSKSSEFLVWDSTQLTLKINQQEESNMSNRRVVNVQLMDDDKGLDVAFCQVYDFGNVVTEDTNEVMIQELIMDNDMAGILLAHNAERMEQVNLELQDRTGQTVNLRPVKLKQLRWIIK